MSSNLSLSRIVWSEGGVSEASPKEARLYSFEQAAYVTQTSVALIERFAALGLIEPTESMLRRQDLIRMVQIQRLRHDLGLNLVGAAMVLEWQLKLLNSKPNYVPIAQLGVKQAA